ncbi:hypothetical protein D3C72_553530 [compost metagenome]
MTKEFLVLAAALTLSFVAPSPAAAQSDPCSTTGGYPAGSPGAVMARLRNLSDGTYDACVQARRARTPQVTWGPARIQTEARGAVLAKLRDPSSALFRNVRRIRHENGTTTFCGEVNARNGYGGMAGFQRFEAGVTDRGEASARLDDQEGLNGAYFRDAWAQFCERIPGTAVQF